jgi:hypothetical protein
LLKDNQLVAVRRQKNETVREMRKALAAIISTLGNIRAHFPETELAFLVALVHDYPELHALAVAEGIIKAPTSLADARRLRSLTRDCPPN